MQLYFQKLTQNNDDMPKITTFVPLKMNRVRSVPHQNNLEIRNAKHSTKLNLEINKN